MFNGNNTRRGMGKREESLVPGPSNIPGESYRCNYENCTYAGTRSNAEQHFMSIHTTERLYVCVHKIPEANGSQCGRSYACAKELHYHQEVNGHQWETNSDFNIYTRMHTAAKAHMREFYPRMVLGPKDDPQCSPYRGHLGPSTPTPRVPCGHNPWLHPNTTLSAFQSRPAAVYGSAAATAAPPPSSLHAIMDERAPSYNAIREDWPAFARPAGCEQECTQRPRNEGLSAGNSAQPTPPLTMPAHSQFTLRPARF